MTDDFAIRGLSAAEAAARLAASIVAVLAITVVQERRTERTLEKLRDLSSPRALVVRDGEEQRIAGRDVVRGDLILLREGDRVPADATLFESHGLQVDESLLTGESFAVDKRAGEDRAARAYSGTLVVSGTGRAQVTATGASTELGRIGVSLARVDSGKTLLERETARIVRIVAASTLALCVVVAVAYAATRGDVLGGVLAGLTLAMAMIPEEFPVVLTVFLALGAWRIARHGVLTRCMPAIEMLGAATVLCCDKTGTLTENRMEVARVWRGGWHGEARWDSGDHDVLLTGALASEPQPFDPMERALLDAAKTSEPAATILRRYPLADDFLAVAHTVRTAEGDAIAMKGAPESVLAVCALATDERERVLAAVREAAAEGFRVLAIARAASSGTLPQSPRERVFEFHGLVAFADPLRPAVPAAVALCRRAGIRVVMITGDHPSTALSIARQAGLDATRADLPGNAGARPQLRDARGGQPRAHLRQTARTASPSWRRCCRRTARCGSSRRARRPPSSRRSTCPSSRTSFDSLRSRQRRSRCAPRSVPRACCGLTRTN